MLLQFCSWNLRLSSLISLYLQHSRILYIKNNPLHCHLSNLKILHASFNNVVTAMSKILELCVMKLIETLLLTSDNQFGFKRQHGTDFCIFTVKSVINYNLCNTNSPVFTWFLDASKA